MNWKTFYISYVCIYLTWMLWAVNTTQVQFLNYVDYYICLKNTQSFWPDFVFFLLDGHLTTSEVKLEETLFEPKFKLVNKKSQVILGETNQ